MNQIDFWAVPVSNMHFLDKFFNEKLQRNYKEITKKLQRNYKEITNKLQINYK